MMRRPEGDEYLIKLMGAYGLITAAQGCLTKLLEQLRELAVISTTPHDRGTYLGLRMRVSDAVNHLYFVEGELPVIEEDEYGVKRVAMGDVE